uniref:Pentatricopeptide repeat-containing protein n=1 Tax=Opuntia streptacantha TaxID=393608 RepID=A0A7C9E8D1_OPUST
MLNRLHQWRPHRLPLLLRPLSAFPCLLFSKSAVSAAAISDDSSPSTAAAAADEICTSSIIDTVHEIVNGLKNYGLHQFLTDNYFRGTLASALDGGTVDQILYKLRAESPELALEFFNFLKYDWGFHHSRASVFVVAHILAQKQRLKQLQELLMSMVQAEGQ